VHRKIGLCSVRLRESHARLMFGQMHLVIVMEEVVFVRINNIARHGVCHHSPRLEQCTSIVWINVCARTIARLYGVLLLLLEHLVFIFVFVWDCVCVHQGASTVHLLNWMVD